MKILLLAVWGVVTAACSQAVPGIAQALPEPLSKLAGVELGMSIAHFRATRPSAVGEEAVGFNEPLGEWHVVYRFHGAYGGAGVFEVRGLGQVVVSRPLAADESQDDALDTAARALPTSTCTGSRTNGEVWRIWPRVDGDLMIGIIPGDEYTDVAGVHVVPASVAIVWRDSEYRDGLSRSGC